MTPEQFKAQLIALVDAFVANASNNARRAILAELTSEATSADIRPQRTSTKHMRVVQLHLEGKRNIDIATEMGISQISVATCLHRARARGLLPKYAPSGARP